MCRRQPKKILLPPELPVFLAEPVELGTLLAGEQTLVPGIGRALVNTALPQPAGQAAGRKAKALSNNIAGEALLQAERNGLLLLLCREPASVPVISWMLSGGRPLMKCSSLHSRQWARECWPSCNITPSGRVTLPKWVLAPRVLVKPMNSWEDG